MKHLFLAENDYAASGNAFRLALASVGEATKCFIGRNHEYGYPHQGQLIGKSLDNVRDAIGWADWVWIIQSDLPLCMGGFEEKHIGLKVPPGDEWRQILKKKRVALLHGGGYYRDHRHMHWLRWRRYEPLSICYEADLMGSFANEHLVIPPLDPNWVPHYRRKWKEFRVGHFPSRPEDKGSEWIVPLLKAKKHRHGLDFRTSVTETGVHNVLWPMQMERMARCDVIVDQIKPELNGKPFGEWVSIATETAMMGRIPIANSLNPQPYIDSYGCMPGIHICNTEAALGREIDRLAGLSDTELNQEQEACREWATTYHSLEATGRLLLTLL